MIQAIFALYRQQDHFLFGLKGSQPLLWDIPEDMANFKEKTSGDDFPVVVMGANTFRSLKAILPNRTNVVLSKADKIQTTNGDQPDLVLNSYEELLEYIRQSDKKVSIIGGYDLIKNVVQDNLHSDFAVRDIFITDIAQDLELDLTKDYIRVEFDDLKELISHYGSPNISRLADGVDLYHYSLEGHEE